LFEEELDSKSKAFKMYRMPFNFNDIIQRDRIDNNAQFLEFVKSYIENFANPPSLYIFNTIDDSSPTKLPEITEAKAVPEDSKYQSSISSYQSTNSTKAKEVRERDDNTCLACGYKADSQPACHFLERKHFQILSKVKRREILQRLKLDSVNSITNMITLCVPCHKQFDSYNLGIEPNDNKIMITDSLRDSKSKNGAGELFKSLERKVITFNGDPRFTPSLELKKYRFNYFKGSKVVKVKRKRKTTTAKPRKKKKT